MIDKHRFKNLNHVFICVYDPDQQFSGSYLFGLHFITTLKDGHLTVDSIWFRSWLRDLVVVKWSPARPQDTGSHSRQMLVCCPEEKVRDLPLPVKWRIERCREKAAEGRWR